MEDDLGYETLAAEAERKANSAEALHLAALWRELAQTYRELAAYHRHRHDLSHSNEFPEARDAGD